jgi:hypothetical protein
VLLLVWKLRFNLFFYSPQKERPKDLMETIDNEELLFLSERDRLFFSRSLRDSDGKPFFKVIAAVEDFGEEEVEESPKFSQVVLKRSTSEE